MEISAKPFETNHVWLLSEPPMVATYRLSARTPCIRHEANLKKLFSQKLFFCSLLRIQEKKNENRYD